MRKYAAIAAIAATPFVALAALRPQFVPDQPDSRAAINREHFGAQIVLTPDEGTFKRAWVSAPRLPAVPTAGEVRRGSSIAAVLVFQGCQANTAGRCDVVADFSLLSPSGTLLRGGEVPMWTDEPLPGALHLGNASMGIAFGERDVAGRYRVIATVRDKVSGRTLSISSALDVR